MHPSAPSFFPSLLISLAAAAAATTTSSKQALTRRQNLFSPPLITPSPDPFLAASLLLQARQGGPRPPDGRTDFIGWYTVSDTWVSATCPPDDYFAADETWGVCCHRSSPHCDMATACGGPYGNYAMGPNGQADCGPRKTCDTVTMLQTKGSTDARRIIFCIAISEVYVLPMTWYRVTYPLPQPPAATVTVTHRGATMATAATGNSTLGTSRGAANSPLAGLSSLAVVVWLLFGIVVP
ncbi:hypothetical protein Cob_v002371 [Colletotrichum orbiculare MAFF 240422]|uniref:Uncharacterized protein n=1 Tax=Colletotrichum orbiculare (strain 104-T / ATCC 96160 / CBS 514.97 / LARS 414 / MAFF 240422) TaxID=1213857 RepID=A0A484G3K1_COLOR|nr:hypothetical protein Cob_v002371 [Colletotrichum orbiculare MAFF 240422]